MFILWCRCYWPLVGEILCSTHPVRQVVSGGTTPYWLRATQLEAGGTCPVKLKNLSHRQKRPLASSSTPIEPWLITGNCHSSCCFLHRDAAEVFSPGRKSGQIYGETVSSKHQNPPLGLAGRIQRNGEPVHSVPGWLQQLPEHEYGSCLPVGLCSKFFVGVYSLSLCRANCCLQGRRVIQPISGKALEGVSIRYNKQLNWKFYCASI